jgi:hypothetical protein
MVAAPLSTAKLRLAQRGSARLEDLGLLCRRHSIINSAACSKGLNAAKAIAEQEKLMVERPPSLA